MLKIILSRFPKRVQTTNTKAWLSLFLPLITLILAIFLDPSSQALASVGGHEGSPHLDGAHLAIWWVIPFVGMLLSIALFPLLAPHFWDHNFGKIAVAWALVFFVPSIMLLGTSLSVYTLIHTIVAEYVPFIVLLLALFAIAGGIRIKGSLSGTPKMNLVFLIIGAILASIMGTTGASMLLIRPYIAASSHRRYRVHTIVFFIFIVSNIGGSLTPLGDPPLFLGFLQGVTFFWTAVNIWTQTLLMEVALFIIH
jgi:Na+/H+ antiporter NhaD/arsenite permease-like protein